jgi:hypothetical protein
VIGGASGLADVVAGELHQPNTLLHADDDANPSLGPDLVDLVPQRSGDGHGLFEASDVRPFGGGDLPLRVGCTNQRSSRMSPSEICHQQCRWNTPQAIPAAGG